MRNIGELPLYQRLLAPVVIGASALSLAACGAQGETEATPPAAATAEPFSPSTSGPSASDPESAESERYPVHERVTGSIFWIGEPAGPSNGYITNEETAWHSDPIAAFGGVDGPSDSEASLFGAEDIARDEHGVPTEFTPLMNPFYCALPAGEFTETGLIPGARERSPWRDEDIDPDESAFLGRNIKVWNSDNTKLVAYVQWVDVGPYVEDNYGYVFETERPANEANESADNLGAGIDVSPAAAKLLGITDGSGRLSWQFVDDVPDGPWSRYPAITNTPNWE